MRIEQVPDIPMFRQNTAGFVHEIPAGLLADVNGSDAHVRVQVLTNAGALDRGRQLAVVAELTRLVAEAAGDPSIADRTWVLLTEAPDGGWGLHGQAHTNSELIAAARAEVAAVSTLQTASAGPGPAIQTPLRAQPLPSPISATFSRSRSVFWVPGIGTTVGDLAKQSRQADLPRVTPVRVAISRGSIVKFPSESGRSMTEDVHEDPSSHLDPVVVHLSERFPEAGRDHVAEVVWDVYNRLNADATVPDHLAALTQHHAQERLRAETVQAQT